MTLRNLLIGEGSLARQCAEILLRRRHELVGILTSDEQLAAWARRRRIPTQVPNGNIAELLADREFDYLLSVANFKVLSPQVLALPRRGAINFHDSPLPRYAGVHATSWALIRGERRHGVTWHRATETIDAGDILKTQSVEIDEGETAASLNVKCFEAAVDSFEGLLDDLEVQNGQPTPQDLSRRSYFERWRRPRGAGLLDWSLAAQESEALVRALDFGPYRNPLTVPKLIVGDAVAALEQCEVMGSNSGRAPGTLLEITDDSLRVATATADVRIAGLTDLEGNPLSPPRLAEDLEVGDPIDRLTDDERELLTRLHGWFCRHESYWLERLSQTLRGSLPGLRPATEESPVEHLALAVGKAIERYLERRPASTRVALLTAALVAVVARHTEDAPLDVGIPVTPRSGWSSVAIQLFAASVPMRVDGGRTGGFDGLVDRVAEHLARTTDRRTYALDIFLRYPRLRGRARAARPLFAMVGEKPSPHGHRLPDGALFGLTLGATPELLWRRGAVEPGFEARLAEEIDGLLRSAAMSDVSLEAPIDAAPGATETVLERLNATAVDYPRDASIPSLFEHQVDRAPDRIAVSCAGVTLTYGELESRSNRLAGILIERGAGPGSTVGVLLERTLELPVALMAVLKAGAAYLPLDPDYPAERLNLMLEDSGTELIVTERSLDARRPQSPAAVLVVDDLDTDAKPAARPAGRAGGEDLAYVIYTSGSTGRPKGVEIPHRSVINFLRSMAETPGLSEDDVVLAVTTISFDISVLELFLPLSVGARIELVSREVAADGILLLDALQRSDVTMMQATPASWRMLLDAGWQGDSGLTALCGGEALPLQLAERLLTRCRKLWNVYGPTETTIWSTLALVESADAPISIGRPIANTRVHVVDDELRPVPPGQVGELVIAGDGLARGYRNQPELTAERFVASRSSATGEPCLYRTGDLARITADGTLECLGRIDHQVKIRGFRIEPGEIESALESHPAVRSAVVVAREDSTGSKRLVAYVVPAGEAPDDLADALRARLAAELPSHMVPSAIVELDELPLTGSGKVDRNALPDPAAGMRFEPTGALPTSDMERAIAAVWEDALELRPVGVDDDFFALGGHSLLLHQVRMRLQTSLGVDLTMVELFRHPTIARLAAHLESRTDAPCEDTEVYGRGDPHPLAVMARRFLIPRPLLTLYFYFRFRAKVSPRAEVEPSPHMTLGRGTTIGSFTKLKADKGPLVIGERSSFANGCFIGSGTAGLTIGRDLVCGPNVTIVPSNYVIDRKDMALADQGHTSKGIRIGDNVWIGAGSTILDGSEIGDNTIVAAGSVVDRKFEGDRVLRGNPAEVVTER